MVNFFLATRTFLTKTQIKNKGRGRNEGFKKQSVMDLNKVTKSKQSFVLRRALLIFVVVQALTMQSTQSAEI